MSTTDQTTPQVQQGSKALHIVLWIAQALLAVAFLMAGGMKVVLPWTPENPIPELLVRFIGIAEVAGDRPPRSGADAHQAMAHAARRRRPGRGDGACHGLPCDAWRACHPDGRIGGARRIRGLGPGAWRTDPRPLIRQHADEREAVSGIRNPNTSPAALGSGGSANERLEGT